MQFDQLKRRDFITLLGGAAAAWPRAARAQQQPERMRRIGVLLSVAESDLAQLSGFTLGLTELGWIEGRNLRMEVRWGGGDVDQIRTFHYNGKRGQSRSCLWLSLIRQSPARLARRSGRAVARRALSRSVMDSLQGYRTQAVISPAS
jgi:hypothetical protein